MQTNVLSIRNNKFKIEEDRYRKIFFRLKTNVERIDIFSNRYANIGSNSSTRKNLCPNESSRGETTISIY